MMMSLPRTAPIPCPGRGPGGSQISLGDNDNSAVINGGGNVQIVVAGDVMNSPTCARCLVQVAGPFWAACVRPE